MLDTASWHHPDGQLQGCEGHHLPRPDLPSLWAQLDDQVVLKPHLPSAQATPGGRCSGPRCRSLYTRGSAREPVGGVQSFAAQTSP